MKKISISTDNEAFEAALIEAANPTRIVLFAAGSGGNPERYIPLLASLAEHGCTVIAPHFERLVSPNPNSNDLMTRARRLKYALDFIGSQNFPVIGIGHSIGATLLVALAGGQMWMNADERLPIPHDERLKRLVLFTPPTGFFRAPKSLGEIRVPIQIWAGTNDLITPRTQAEFLKHALGPQLQVDLRVIDGAGHFSFMNTLPPQMSDSMPNRERFLSDLASDVLSFSTAVG